MLAQQRKTNSSVNIKKQKVGGAEWVSDQAMGVIQQYKTKQSWS